MAVALLTVPILIRGLGTERFGVLTVGWVVIGYFGLFDFGLGRALTKLVAERMGTERREEIPSLVWVALSLTFLLGVLGALVLAVLAPWLVSDALKISPALQGEARDAFRLLAFSLPWVISTAGLLGVLEASQSFGLVNALRVPMGLFSYVGPLAVLPFSHSLVPVVGLLVVGRLLGWGAHLAACLRVFPVLRERVHLDWSRVGMLARFGGWMTVSNVISPLMTHLDRFLVGALISMSAVAYYATPYELVTRLWLVPSALMGVFFPAFAATFAADRARTRLLFDRAGRAIFLALFPITLAVIALAREGMGLWLGADFALHSSRVLQWLAIGVFINCLAQVPFALVQGVGRPDLTGKLHLAELPVYAVAIWLFSRAYGIEGVAMAWVVRVALDTAALYAMADHFVDHGRLLRSTAVRVAGASVAFGLAMTRSSLTGRLVVLGAALAGFAVLAWLRLLAPEERAFLLGRTPRLRPGDSSTAAL